MMLFGFGRVPGCLGLGALFLWDEWQSVRSVFWECEVWWSDGRVVGHQRCAGWLQGLSFLVVCREVVGYQCCAGWLQGLSLFVVCWEMVWHRRCAGCGWGEFFCGLS